MKNLWQQLKSDYQIKIRPCSYKHDLAKKLNYTLMAPSGWYDLNLETIRGILIYTDTFSHDVTGTDIMYGHKFLKSQDND